jgi:hypothetical protein
MKTKSLHFIALSLIVMLRAPYCSGQSNAVFYGASSNSLGVAFVDTTLSASAKSAIVSDLQLCLREWGKQMQFRLGADDPAFVAHLYNPDLCPNYPENLDFPNHVINSPNGLALQIPKALSDAYTNAFAFATANSNIVAAAYEFVAFVSSSNFVSLSSNVLPNYILDKNTTSNEIVADAQANISQLRHQTYYPPSVLGFEYSEIGPSSTNLWLRVPCSSPSGSGWVEWSPFAAVWHEGKWKFGFGYE